jgi:hypothetical protein
MRPTEQRIREIVREEIKAAMEKGAAMKTAHPYGDSQNGVCNQRKPGCSLIQHH